MWPLLIVLTIPLLLGGAGAFVPGGPFTGAVPPGDLPVVTPSPTPGGGFGVTADRERTQPQVVCSFDFDKAEVPQKKGSLQLGTFPCATMAPSSPNRVLGAEENQAELPLNSFSDSSTSGAVVY